MSKVKTYAKAILLPLLAGLVVGAIVAPSMDYETLQKPPLAPPAVLFPIVWTILYILMGVSQGILKSNNLSTTETDSIYYAQLLVNLLWPVIFFVFKWIFFALLWIILLAVLVLKMILTFYAKHKTAGLLQIPYFVWVLFATYLNLGIVLLN